VLCTAPCGLCRFLLPFDFAQGNLEPSQELSFDRAEDNPERSEGLRGPAPRGYNGDGECVVGTARLAGGGTVRAAEGRIHSPCTGLSFADKQ
jgi:hypothetical protein